MSRPVAVFESDDEARLERVRKALEADAVKAVLLPAAPGSGSSMKRIMVDDYAVKKAASVLEKLELNGRGVLITPEVAPAADEQRQERGFLSSLKKMLTEDK